MARTNLGDGDFDFGFEVGIELPVGTDLPQQHDMPWRLPYRDPAPRAFAAVDAAFEPPAPGAGFDDDLCNLGRAD